jgi:HSP20 family protein
MRSLLIVSSPLSIATSSPAASTPGANATISIESSVVPLLICDDTRTYAQERFAGIFRRAIELPQNADPDKVQARYTNGCLSTTVGRRESSKPRAITVQ